MNAPALGDADGGRSFDEERLSDFGLPLPDSRIRQRMAKADGDAAAIDLLVDATHAQFRTRFLKTIEQATRKQRSTHLHQGRLPRGHPAGDDCIECAYMIDVVTYDVHESMATAALNTANRPPRSSGGYVATAARRRYIDAQRKDWSLQQIERDTPPVGEHAGLNTDETDLLVLMMYFVNSNDRLGDPWPIDRWSGDLNREPDDLQRTIDRVLNAVRECCPRHAKWIAQRLDAPLSARLAELGVEDPNTIADVEIDDQTDAFDRQLMEDLKVTYVKFRSTVDPRTALLCAIRDQHGPEAANRAEQVNDLDALVTDLGFETELPDIRGSG